MEDFSIFFISANYSGVPLLKPSELPLIAVAKSQELFSHDGDASSVVSR